MNDKIVQQKYIIILIGVKAGSTSIAAPKLFSDYSQICLPARQKTFGVNEANICAPFAHFLSEICIKLTQAPLNNGSGYGMPKNGHTFMCMP